jgi:hypothetical protein
MHQKQGSIFSSKQTGGDLEVLSLAINSQCASEGEKRRKERKELQTLFTLFYYFFMRVRY